jgi:hypothetical protein
LGKLGTTHIVCFEQCFINLYTFIFKLAIGNFESAIGEKTNLFPLEQKETLDDKHFCNKGSVKRGVSRTADPSRGPALCRAAVLCAAGGGMLHYAVGWLPRGRECIAARWLSAT